MIVVDTNVLCYHWMPSSLSDVTERALAKDPEWIAPLLWRSEFHNALAGALRHKLIDLRDALTVMGKAERQLSGREFPVSSRGVLQLVEQSGCSAYDCEFVALAMEKSVPLVTVDRQVLKDFGNVAVSLQHFISDTGRG